MAAKTNTPAGLANLNDRRRAEALARRIRRQDRWRTSVWARAEQNIREAQVELSALHVNPIPVNLLDPGMSDIALERLRANSERDGE